MNEDNKINQQKNGLTVKQLIELLKEVDPDAEVWMEGCDCWQKAVGVEVQSKQGEILIINPEHQDD